MKDFAAIDFETANGKRTSVCSVGIVIVKGGRIVNKIYRLIRPAPNYYTQWAYLWGRKAEGGGEKPPDEAGFLAYPVYIGVLKRKQHSDPEHQAIPAGNTLQCTCNRGQLLFCTGSA